ncbi:MAG: autophagy 5 [Lasallia pustulata]|uniref:Autophagy 5 n=1 Tax=Lasallia pustulata TaxID=136370 RepID=A0A5M8PEZ9_9LECA|nr:MAG: autophagy 5 [Lasallia pustulata]
MTTPTELRALQEVIWNGSLPLEIRLSPSESRTYDQTDPYLIHYPRLSYLPFLLPPPRLLRPLPHLPLRPPLLRLVLLRIRPPKMALPARPPLGPLLRAPPSSPPPKTPHPTNPTTRARGPDPGNSSSTSPTGPTRTS